MIFERCFQKCNQMYSQNIDPLVSHFRCSALFLTREGKKSWQEKMGAVWVR